MTNSQAAPGVVGPFAGLDVPWLLRMRAESRRDHPFLIWAPFEAPARSWSYGEFHERVGALAAGLVKRGVKPGEYRADPSRQLHRGDAGLVCLRRARRHRGHHQHPLGGGGNGIFRRSLRRGGRDHPARLCRTDLGAIAGPALDRGDLARRRQQRPRQAAPRAATVSKRCSPTAPTGRAAPPIRSRRAACNIPPAPRRARRRCCGPTPMRCGAPRSTPRMRTCMQATCTRPICRCFTPMRWPIRCWRALWVGATCVIQPRFSASRFWNVALEHGCTWTSTIPFCMKALLEHEIPKTAQIPALGHRGIRAAAVCRLRHQDRSAGGA